MIISEREQGIIDKPGDLILTGKRPTVLDLILTLESWRKEVPQTSLITVFGESSRGTHFEVIDHKRAKQILKELKGLDILAELPGEVFVHQFPKA